MPHPFSLANKTALVTGSSRGIGLSIAKTLHQAGASVILSGTNEATLQQAAAQVGEGTRYIIADLSTPSAPKTLAEQAGPVDILVNNAGITQDGLFLRQKEAAWNTVLQVNLTAAVQLTQALLPAMLKTGGRIINISSVVGHTGNAGQTNYVAAKAGLTGFTKALAQEVARKNITVNCVAPGFIQTDMTDKLSDEQKTAYAAEIPMQRLGAPEDIATAVLFLASPAAAYITGATLHVNGGMLME